MKIGSLIKKHKEVSDLASTIVLDALCMLLLVNEYTYGNWFHYIGYLIIIISMAPILLYFINLFSSKNSEYDNYIKCGMKTMYQLGLAYVMSSVALSLTYLFIG